MILDQHEGVRLVRSRLLLHGLMAERDRGVGWSCPRCGYRSQGVFASTAQAERSYEFHVREWCQAV